MSAVNRTLLAFLALVPAMVAAAVVVEQLELSSWATTGVAVAFTLLVTLIDREGFYGPRAPRKSSSSAPR